RLAGIARYLLGDEVYIHQSRLNYKPGFFGKEFYWHSDFETWHVEDGMPRMRALSMSISLTQNTEYNGPLMIIPGSHRRYVRCVGATPDDHYKQSLRRQEYGVPDPESLQSLFEEGGIATTKGSAVKGVLVGGQPMPGCDSNLSPLPRDTGRSLQAVAAPAGVRRAGPRELAVAVRGRRHRNDEGIGGEGRPVRLQRDARIEQQHLAAAALERLPGLQQRHESGRHPVRRQAAAPRVHRDAQVVQAHSACRGFLRLSIRRVTYT